QDPRVTGVQTCALPIYHLPDETKHPEPLDDIEPNDGEYPDHCSDQRRADKALVPCYAHNQAESQQRKTDLDKNAQCDVDENARRDRKSTRLNSSHEWIS